MRYVDAVLCAIALLLVEWLVVVAGGWGEFAGGFEVTRTFITVLPLGVITALPVAVGGAICVHATSDASRWGRWWLAAPAVLLAGLTAYGVSADATSPVLGDERPSCCRSRSGPGSRLSRCSRG